jgi:hypothetical protein
MPKYIFSTKAKAEKYNADCVIAHGHHNSTSNWDIVIKHPTLRKYAIEKGSVTVKNTEIVEQLSNDWINEEIL